MLVLQARATIPGCIMKAINMSKSLQSGNRSRAPLCLGAWSQVELESGISPVSPSGTLETGSFSNF